MLKSCTWDPKHGITGYKPVGVKEDYGVDAIGLNANGDTTAIQCKYRSNPKDLVHYADMARTFTHGIVSYGLDPDKRANVWLVTTAEDANHIAHKVFGKRLHVLGYDHLSLQTDGNASFWKALHESM